MRELLEVLFLLLVFLSTGGAGLLAVLARFPINPGFFTFTSFIVSILSLIGIVSRPRGREVTAPLVASLSTWQGRGVVSFFVFTVLIVVSTLFFWQRKSQWARGLLILSVPWGAVAVACFSLTYGGHILTVDDYLFLPLHFLLSSLLLGTVTVGMILGHWYLVTALPIAPLRLLSNGFLTLMILYGLLIPLFLLVMGAEDAVFSAMALSDFLGLAILIRLGIGLAIPFLLSLMIWWCVKSRSTMSATGLLYLAMLCVMAGESFSLWLLVTHSLLL